MIMERTKRRHSFLVILSTVVAFALLSTDIFLPTLIDPPFGRGRRDKLTRYSPVILCSHKN